MNWNQVKVASVAAGILAAVVLSMSAGESAQAPKPPVVSLKAFVSVPAWQLDITWTAMDSFDNEDFNATLDMTATARLILKQSDKQDAWGRWHVEKALSDNFTINAALVNKHDHSRNEYKSAGKPAIDAGAILQVGGETPGYQLVCNAAFPVKLTTPLMGTIDSLVTLLTTDINGPSPVFASGPLPQAGTTIHGSVVFPMTVPPFGAEPVPLTRVGIQFVLQPYDPALPLAPLVPNKKK